MKYYRFVCNNKGIYEQVDLDCPTDSPLRKNKPDGAWLKKVGPDYPNAISFFTEEGLQKYTESGLKDWHSSVVNGEVKMIVVHHPKEILYEDEYQIIVMPDKITIS